MQLRVDHFAAESGPLFLLDRLIGQNRIGSREAGAEREYHVRHEVKSFSQP
jgi:hypothetical protein